MLYDVFTVMVYLHAGPIGPIGPIVFRGESEDYFASGESEDYSGESGPRSGSSYDLDELHGYACAVAARNKLYAARYDEQGDVLFR